MRDIRQAVGQDISGPVQEGLIAGFPVGAFEKQVPKFDQGYIPYPASASNFSIPLSGFLALTQVPKLGSVRTEPNIHDGFDPPGQQYLQKVFRGLGRHTRSCSISLINPFHNNNPVKGSNNMKINGDP